MINSRRHEPLSSITASSYARQALAVLALSLAPTLTHASPAPLEPRLEPRADSGSHSVEIWVPILVVVLVLVAVGAMFWWRKSLREGFMSMGETAALAAGMGSSGTTPATREVTADQLVGQTGGGAGATASAPLTTGRRPRRNRRTPSQISTHSLPLYNKEPGDQELVIYRGQDPEDNPEVPVTVVMPVVDESAEAGHSREGSYGHLPESMQYQSLMQGDESLDTAADTTQDASTRHLLPPAAAVRGSFETIAGSEESAPLQQDPRGEAPAYFEAVDLSDTVGPRRTMRGHAPSHSAPAGISQDGVRQSTDTQGSQENRGSRRMSGFRGLLSSFGPSNTARPPIPPIPAPAPESPPRRIPGHTRGQSSASVLSSADAHMPRDRAASRASHHSGASGSMMAVFRTISRQKSHTTMNSGQFKSPSMISLNSISAPLSHTLTRTEISYPASGPTAEQMRLISSRESFARFAVPYGADAIAFAASASRQDLEPTPDYSESHPSLVPPPISGLPATMSTSRLSQSPLAAPPVVEERSASPDSLQEAPADSSAAPTSEEAKEEAALEEQKEEAPEPEPSSSAPVAAAPAAAEPTKEPATVSPQATEELELPRSLSPPADAPAADTDFSPATDKQKAPAKYGSLTPSVPPPSSFKLNPVADVRPESRASSMLSGTSFATADEEMYESAPSGTHTPEDMPSTPLVSTFGSRTRDFTGSTITPGGH